MRKQNEYSNLRDLLFSFYINHINNWKKKSKFESL